MPDFRVTGQGSVYSIEAVSDDAKEFARQNFDVEGWMGVPERFTTDHGPARDLVLLLINDGFEIEGEP